MTFRLDYKKLLVFAIFLYAFILRIYILHYPHYAEDGNRDYLVSSHIIKYGEYPLAVNIDGKPINSPIYFYLHAIPLLLKNDMITVGWTNLIGQMLALYFIYLLAKKIFGFSTAVLTILFVGLSSNFILESNYTWHPWFMQPFLMASYYYLYLYLNQGKYRYAIVSIYLYVLSLAIHNSVFLLLPLYLGLIFFHSLKKKQKFSRLVRLIFVFIASVFINFFPVIIYLIKNPSQIKRFYIFSNPEVNYFSFDFLRFLKQFYLNFLSLYEYAFPDIGKFIDPFIFIILSLIILLVSLLKKGLNKKLGIGILYYLFLTSFMKKPDPLPVRYITPILMLFCLLLAERINNLVNFRLSSIFKFTFVLSLIILTNRQFLDLNNSLLSHFYSSKSAFTAIKKLIFKEYIIPPAVAKVKEEVINLKQSYHFQDYDFFQFKSYLQGKYHEYVNAVFWTPLELEFKRKFTRVDDNANHVYSSFNEDKFIFLICKYSEMENCKELFLKYHKNFNIIKIIDPSDFYYRIYLAKRVG